MDCSEDLEVRWVLRGRQKATVRCTAETAWSRINQGGCLVHTVSIKRLENIVRRHTERHTKSHTGSTPWPRSCLRAPSRHC